MRWGTGWGRKGDLSATTERQEYGVEVRARVRRDWCRTGIRAMGLREITEERV